MVRSLLYAAVISRPKISQTVSTISTYDFYPTESSAFIISEKLWTRLSYMYIVKLVLSSSAISTLTELTIWMTTIHLVAICFDWVIVPVSWLSKWQNCRSGIRSWGAICSHLSRQTRSRLVKVAAYGNLPACCGAHSTSNDNQSAKAITGNTSNCRTCTKYIGIKYHSFGKQKVETALK